MNVVEASSVVKDCWLDGLDDFWNGGLHRPSYTYLLLSQNLDRLSESMATRLVPGGVISKHVDC